MQPMTTKRRNNALIGSLVAIALLRGAPVRAQSPSGTTDLLSAYEELRTTLANDATGDGRAVRDSCRAISTAAGRLRSEVPATTGEGAARATSIASQLQAATVRCRATAPAEVETLREVFGDISRCVIQWIEFSRNWRDIRTSLLRFRCPMARGYGDWVQPTGTPMANPYMGRRMLRCGRAITW